MKIFSGLLVPVLFLLFISGCTGKGGSKKEAQNADNTTIVPDTGFTGITKYKSGDLIVKEVTFKNGIREGITRTFTVGGQLYQTFWYRNNLREDSACLFYTEGQVFRITPFKHDTIDGIQKQYYRTGELRARIGFSKGLRTQLFEEFEKNGKLFRNYPELVVNIKDEYKTRGLYRIGLELSDKSTKTKFYRGGFTDGRMDTALCQSIRTIDGKTSLNLKKTNQSQPTSVEITAFILTPLGNRYITTRKIDLPYRDLN